ncbi:uncharacterized protein LOC108808448 [Raphanus sativus]|uniref:Uncharacterized protein LOC108808448 n=1 Tax=Raphanus sativus TaxID=3726 RepID=A0A9W3BVB4_RAPSA|nr:uncharacterized protein LOC108808448 [Raphanus sativus]
MTTSSVRNIVSFEDRATASQAKPRDNLLVIELTIQDIDVARILVDTGCSANVIYKSTLERMGIDLNTITDDPSLVVGLSGNNTMTLGSIDLSVKTGSVTKNVEFLVVDGPTAYNVIVGTPWLNSMRAIPSTFHLCLKFPTPSGVETIQGDRGSIANSPEIFRQSQRAESLEGKREPTCEPVVSIYLDESYPERCVEIGANLREPLKAELIACLQNNLNTFDWTAEDMPGIDISITCHKLNIDQTHKPVKQKRQKLGPERATAVNEEVEKLLKVRSITEVKYPDWIANPIVVKKKNGKWRVCVDFTYLNKACPKDCFPLPHIDRPVEATAGNKRLSFMDAFSGYNQIMMNPDDREKLHLSPIAEHIATRFAVASGEFLGYLVAFRGIEANPKQIDALIEMVSPRTKREILRLTGRVTALNCFISRSTD